MGSIIQYSRPVDLQKDQDADFKEMHPVVDITLSLTMIRRMKQSMFEIGKYQFMELSSIAMSFVYFERLVMKGFLLI